MTSGGIAPIAVRVARPPPKHTLAPGFGFPPPAHQFPPNGNAPPPRSPQEAALSTEQQHELLVGFLYRRWLAKVNHPRGRTG